MHTARKLDEHEGLQVPVKAKPIKQWTIPEKSKQGRLSEDILFWKKSLDFLGLSLTFGLSLYFILEKTKLHHPRKFHKILLHPLEIPMPSKNQYPWKFLINFFIIPGNSTSFSLKLCNIHMLFLHLIPLEIPCPQPTLLLGFFLEWPITELLVVLFSQKY